METEVAKSIRGNDIEQLGFRNEHSREGEIAEYFLGLRLLDQAKDAIVSVNMHNAAFSRVRNTIKR